MVMVTDKTGKMVDFELYEGQSSSAGTKIDRPEFESSFTSGQDAVMDVEISADADLPEGLAVGAARGDGGQQLAVHTGQVGVPEQHALLGLLVRSTTLTTRSNAGRTRWPARLTGTPPSSAAWSS